VNDLERHAMATRIIDLLKHPVRALQEWQSHNLTRLERVHDDDASDPEHITHVFGHDTTSNPIPVSTSPYALFPGKLNPKPRSENLDPASQRASLEVDILNLGNNVEYLIEKGLTKPKENYSIHTELKKLHEKHQILHLTLMTQQALFLPQYQHQFDDLRNKLVSVEQQIAHFVASHTLLIDKSTIEKPDISAQQTFGSLFSSAKPKLQTASSSETELQHLPSETTLQPKSKN
jgi:hypothetical protein